MARLWSLLFTKYCILRFSDSVCSVFYGSSFEETSAWVTSFFYQVAIFWVRNNSNLSTKLRSLQFVFYKYKYLVLYPWKYYIWKEIQLFCSRYIVYVNVFTIGSICTSTSTTGTSCEIVFDLDRFRTEWFSTGTKY